MTSIRNRGTEYKENHPLFSEDFFTDSNRSLYWKGFLKRIKYSKQLSFTDVGALICTHLQPYWDLLHCNNEKSASINENLRKENRDLKRKAYPERYVLPSFINVEATRIYEDKQGQCDIAMKFTGGSKEYSEKMSNENFMAFRNGDLTKEEVIAKYHKSLIEGYIRREFSRPEKRFAALSLIENTIFGYMKLYASSTFVPSSNGDNNPRKRRNYDDIDDMNDEERKGLSY